VPAEEPPHLVVRVPVGPSSLEEVHAALTQLLERAGVDDLDQMLLDTALAEIAGNVLQHGTGATAISFTGAVSAERVVIELVDDGERVDVDLDELRGALDDPLAESGRGLAMALAAVDELRYERTSVGNRWELIRYRR
jgi:serine/threonine-protein kinase RsbW